MKKLYFKKAFTLAEVMIVLTIIGILTAILLPSAFHSTPDENIMKFKKANSILYRVINELVSSDMYYRDGDLGVRANGNQLDGTHDGDYTYFCNTFAEIVTTKKVECSDSVETDKSESYVPWGDNKGTKDETTLAEAKVKLDEYCAASQEKFTSGYEIQTADDVVWFQASPKHPFGFCWDGTVLDNNCRRLFAQPGGEILWPDVDGFDPEYKVFCIDVDGKDGEAPFGYGIRADGKIMSGTRADEWTKKSIQNKD